MPSARDLSDEDLISEYRAQYHAGIPSPVTAELLRRLHPSYDAIHRPPAPRPSTGTTAASDGHPNDLPDPLPEPLNG